MSGCTLTQFPRRFGVSAVADVSVLDRVKEPANVLASVLVIVGALSGFGLWVTGGLKPGNQVQTEQVQASVDRLSHQMAEMNAKLDAMPRPSDYAAQDAHFSKLDTQVDALRSQLNRIDIDSATLRTRLDRLDSTPIRTPR